MNEETRRAILDPGYNPIKTSGLRRVPSYYVLEKRPYDSADGFLWPKLANRLGRFKVTRLTGRGDPTTIVDQSGYRVGLGFTEKEAKAQARKMGKLREKERQEGKNNRQYILDVRPNFPEKSDRLAFTEKLSTGLAKIFG